MGIESEEPAQHQMDEVEEFAGPSAEDLLREELQRAQQTIANLEATIAEERAYSKTLEEKNERHRLLFIELRESSEQAMKQIIEEKDAHLDKLRRYMIRFTQSFLVSNALLHVLTIDFRRASEKEEMLQDRIDELRIEQRKKDEKITRLQTSIAIISRTAPFSSHVAVDAGNQMQANGVSPQRGPSRDSEVPSRSPSVSMSPVQRRTSSPTRSQSASMSPIQRRTSSPMRPSTDAATDDAPVVHLPNLSPPLRSPRIVSRSPSPGEKQLEFAVPRVPASTYRKQNTPHSSLPLRTRIVSAPQTPVFIRNMGLSPASKSRALQRTPNTLNAAHAMSMLRMSDQHVDDNSTNDGVNDTRAERSSAYNHNKDSVAQEKDDHVSQTNKNSSVLTEKTPGRELKRKASSQEEGEDTRPAEKVHIFFPSRD